MPTHEARELATRQQQILANEVGAARVADPLGGSYYVEALTDQVEAAAMEILARIEQIGLIEAVKNGTIEAMMDAHNLQFQQELDAEERILVGVNRYVPADDPAPTRFKFDRTNTQHHLQRFADLKRQREQVAWANSLQSVHAAARDGQNPMQAIIDAFIADASIGEIWGTVRVAHGHPYDPYGHLTAPLTYR